MGPSNIPFHSDAGGSQASDTLEDLIVELRVSLTVMLGQSQMLQRRIRNGQIGNAHECLETLALINLAIQKVESRLQRLEQERW